MFEIPRDEALKKYQEFGGIVKLENSKLLYPNKERIESQLAELMQKKKYLDSQIRELRRRNMSISYNSAVSGVTRFTSPIYWEHVVKQIVDQDYREDSKLLEPPVKSLRDSKHMTLMKRFVRDDQYRRSLVESRTGLLGKNRDTISASIRKSLDYSKSLASNRIEKLEAERESFAERISVLNSLLKFFEDSNKSETD